MGYKNILVPLDGSALAEKALLYITPIADPGATIHVLSIVTEDKSLLNAIAISSTYGAGVITENMAIHSHDPRLIYERENYLKEVTIPLQQRGYKIIIDARPGEVVERIIELARDGYDAIVMATHGRTGLSKVILGSVAQSVVVKSPCPVVLIPACADESASH